MVDWEGCKILGDHKKRKLRKATYKKSKDLWRSLG